MISCETLPNLRTGADAPPGGRPPGARDTIEKWNSSHTTAFAWLWAVDGTEMSPLTTQFAGLRGLLSDLERKSKPSPDSAEASVLERDIDRLREEIVDLEADLSRHSPEIGLSVEKPA